MPRRQNIRLDNCRLTECLASRCVWPTRMYPWGTVEPMVSYHSDLLTLTRELFKHSPERLKTATEERFMNYRSGQTGRTLRRWWDFESTHTPYISHQTVKCNVSSSCFVSSVLLALNTKGWLDPLFCVLGRPCSTWQWNTNLRWRPLTNPTYLVCIESARLILPDPGLAGICSGSFVRRLLLFIFCTFMMLQSIHTIYNVLGRPFFQPFYGNPPASSDTRPEGLLPNTCQLLAASSPPDVGSGLYLPASYYGQLTAMSGNLSNKVNLPSLLKLCASSASAPNWFKGILVLPIVALAVFFEAWKTALWSL